MKNICYSIFTWEVEEEPARFTGIFVVQVEGWFVDVEVLKIISLICSSSIFVSDIFIILWSFDKFWSLISQVNLKQTNTHIKKYKKIGC